MALQIPVRAGEEGGASLDFELNPPLGKNERLEPYIARVTLHFPHPLSPGRVETVAEVPLSLGDYLLPGMHYRPPGPVPSWPGPSRFRTKSVSLPALWPGSYPLSCVLAPARTPQTPRGRDGQTASVVAQGEPGLASVAVGRDARPERCSLPLYASNLSYAIYRPGIDSMVEPGGGKIYFTLRRTGYPVVDTARSTGAAQPQTAPGKVADLARRLRSCATILPYANQQPYTTQIFGPAVQRDLDFRRFRADVGVGAPAESRAASNRLSHYGEGVLRGTSEKAGLSVDYEAVVTCSLKALVRDPNNVQALLCAALAAHALKDWTLSCDFFLTALVRLLVAEGVHRAGRSGSGPPQAAAIVESAMHTYLGAGLWELLGRGATTLGIQCSQDEFPSLRSIKT